ncbi:MAG TPA: NUDIX hydrolase, partial [Synergistales bacterium]|nr:NUDIX hydrolase [Synergistales bacterium]
MKRVKLGSAVAEKTIKTKRVFAGRLLKCDVVSVALEKGKKSVREVVRHPGAAAALCRTVDGRFVFVKQFRKAVEKQVLEIVAGTLEPGENPSACARREVREETGYRVSALKKLGVVYPSPGYSDERLHVYLADLRKTRGETDHDHDERIKTVHISRAGVEKKIASGSISDAKTLAAW